MGKAKNILVLAMSTLNSKTKVNKYYCDGEQGNYIEGVSQLEPITKYIIQKLSSINEVLNEVIILSTIATKSKEKEFKYENENGKVCEENITPNEFYKKRIRSWVESEYNALYDTNPIQFHDDIIVNVNEPTEGISKLVELVLEHYSLEEKNKSKLYIDTQGGLRNVVFVMTSAIRLLKIRGIEPDGIYSILFDPTQPDEPSRIVEKTRSYSFSDFVSGMDEFINYGRCKQLLKYYGINVDDDTDVLELIACLEEEDSIKKVLLEITCISQAISLCDIDRLSEHITSILSEIEQYKKSGEIFDLFVDDINKEYSGLLVDRRVDFAKLVEWCIKKEFYQQALTIIESKFPKIFFDKRWYYFEEAYRDEVNKSKKKKKQNYKGDENYFFDSYWRTTKEKLGNVSEHESEQQTYVSQYEERIKDLILCRAYGIGFIKSDLHEENLIVFNQLISSHDNLKKQRNKSNHAAQGEVRLTLQELKNEINNYLRLYRTIDERTH